MATATKDRTRLFDSKHWVPNAATGETLRQWLETGKDPQEESRELLESLKAHVDEIDNLPHLVNWGSAHKAKSIHSCLSTGRVLGLTTQRGRRRFWKRCKRPKPSAKRSSKRVYLQRHLLLLPQGEVTEDLLRQPTRLNGQRATRAIRARPTVERRHGYEHKHATPV